MIHIITGAIGSGKSTRLRAIYDQYGGDGFVLEKIFRSGINAGQRIVRLSTKEGMPFSLKRHNLPDDWDEAEVFRDYSFSRKGLIFAKDIIDEILAAHVFPVYLDEIGPLELLGKGLCIPFQKCLQSEAELYVAAREKCVADIIRYFGLGEGELIFL